MGGWGGGKGVSKVAPLAAESRALVITCCFSSLSSVLMLNSRSKASDEWKMSGIRKLSSAQSSCRLFCGRARGMSVVGDTPPTAPQRTCRGVPVSSRRNSTSYSRTTVANTDFSFFRRCASSTTSALGRGKGQARPPGQPEEDAPPRQALQVSLFEADHLVRGDEGVERGAVRVVVGQMLLRERGAFLLAAVEHDGAQRGAPRPKLAHPVAARVSREELAALVAAVQSWWRRATNPRVDLGTIMMCGPPMDSYSLRKASSEMVCSVLPSPWECGRALG